MDENIINFSQLDIWISIFNTSGSLLFLNKTAEKISGYQARDLEKSSKAIDLLFPKSCRQILKTSGSGTREDRRLDLIVVTHNGQEVSLDCSIVRIPLGDKGTGILILGWPVSKQGEKLGLAFADKLPHVAYIKDEEGRYVYANEAFCRLLGLKCSQILGKTGSQLWPEAVAKRLSKNDRQVLDEGRAISFQEVIGKNQTFLSLKFPLTFPGQPLLGGVSVDISSRIEEEENLKRSKKRYEQTLSLLPDIVLETDREGTITFLNQAGKKILDLTDENLQTGVNALDIVAKRDKDYVESTFYHIMDNPRQEPRLLEFMVRSKDDNIILAGHIVPIIYEHSRVEGIRGVMVDITLLKKKEKALKESEKRYRRLFNSLRDGIYISTLEGKYIDANPALVSMLGYSSRRELLSKDIKRDIYVDGSKRPMPTQRSRPFETQLKKADGSKIWVEISCRVIKKAGKPAFYEGIIRDISTRKEYEQKLRYKSFHDGLTGLYNRAYFEEELSRLDRKRQLPLSIIIGDVNSLKLINDAFGHEQGDQLLKKAAEILRKACRKEDIIARWGGDEFAILLPRTPQEVASGVTERINEIAGCYVISHVPVSISLGKATKIEADQDVRKIIEEAEDNMYRYKLLEKKRISGEVIVCLEQALLKKQYVSLAHIQMVKKAVQALGRSLGLNSRQMEDLSLLAGAYQVGKISIPDRILNKEGPLDESDWRLVKRYPEVGFNIAEAIPQISHLSEAILSHHEHWDGSGYPQGLAGEDIPLYARIIAIADAFSAMIADRHYRGRFNSSQAVEEIKKNAGSQFDPYLVEKAAGALKDIQ